MKGFRTITALFLVILFLVFGFVRDFVFINLNEQASVTYYHSIESHVSASLHFLSAYTYPQLFALKWILTIAFALLFMGLTIAIVRLFYKEKIFLYLTMIAYGVLFLLAAIFFILGQIIPLQLNGYLISRFLMGIAEGPVVLMVLLPAFKLSLWRRSLQK
jgi:hypothetical protein